MPVDQLRLPKTTWALPRTDGAATCTAGISRAIAAASSSVIVCCELVPRRTPAALTEPESTMIRLEPRLWICSATRAWAPAPTATIVMTAPTPMMMPSIVSALRSLFTRSARSAMRTACSAFMVLAGGPDMAPRPPTLGRAPAQPWRASGLAPHVSCRHLFVDGQRGQRGGGVLRRGPQVVAQQPAVAEHEVTTGVGGDV